MLFLESNPFLLMSLLAGFAASIAGGLIGSYVVAKRIVFISGSIAHAVLGGLGIALYLKRLFHLNWLNPIYGALVFAILSAILIGWIHLYYKEREDTAIGSLWTCGMAIGVIFLSLTPGYNAEVMNFLFGNLLWSNVQDVIILYSLDCLIALITLLFHQRFLAICFDENQAKLQKASVKILYFLLLSTIAVSIVLLIQVVGVILVIAILTLPAAIASSWTTRLSKIMLYAILLGCIFTFLGIYFSFVLNWPPGATIALISTLAYFSTLIFKRV